MGACSSRGKQQKLTSQPVSNSGSVEQQSATSSKALEYCDSVSLSNQMRNRPESSFLEDMISKQQIHPESIEQLIQRIEAKTETLLRCFTENTNSAMVIQRKMIDFYSDYYQPYVQCANDTPQNKDWLKNQTCLLTIEVLIILNCLMDKNFDEEAELWWTFEYYQKRFEKLPVVAVDNFKPIIQPILYYLESLKVLICKSLPINVQNHKSIESSQALADQHLKRFYNGMILDLGKSAEEKRIN